jgi:hypothetical protein
MIPLLRIPLESARRMWARGPIKRINLESWGNVTNDVFVEQLIKYAGEEMVKVYDPLRKKHTLVHKSQGL